MKVHFIQSNYPSIDTNFYTLPAKQSDVTNGLFAIAGQSDSDDDSSFLELINLYFMGPVYTDNLLYSTSIYMWVDIYQLDDLRVPSSTDNDFPVNVAITTELFQEVLMYEIHLTIVNQKTQRTWHLDYKRGDQYSDSDLIWKPSLLLDSGSTNSVYLKFSTQAVANVQIRMYTDRPIPDNWLEGQKTEV